MSIVFSSSILMMSAKKFLCSSSMSSPWACAICFWVSSGRSWLPVMAAAKSGIGVMIAVFLGDDHGEFFLLLIPSARAEIVCSVATIISHGEGGTSGIAEGPLHGLRATTFL